MAFQSTVRIDQTTGLNGDLYGGGPIRAIDGILATSNAANNVFGRAFTHVAANDSNVVAGGTGAFAGILFNSKEYVTSGNTTGTLEPTFVLPNATVVSLLQMGYVFASVTNAASIGNDVHFVQADGTLLAVPAGTSPSAGNSVVPNAKIDVYNTTGAGLAVIRLTN